ERDLQISTEQSVQRFTFRVELIVQDLQLVALLAQLCSDGKRVRSQHRLLNKPAIGELRQLRQVTDRKLRARDLGLRDGELAIRLRDLVGGVHPELLQAFTGDRLADLRFTNTERNLVQLRERLGRRPVNQSAELLMRVDVGILARERSQPRIIAKRPSWNREVDLRQRRSGQDGRRQLRKARSLGDGGFLGGLLDIERTRFNLLVSLERGG